MQLKYNDNDNVILFSRELSPFRHLFLNYSLCLTPFLSIPPAFSLSLCLLPRLSLTLAHAHTHTQKFIDRRNFTRFDTPRKTVIIQKYLSLILSLLFFSLFVSFTLFLFLLPSLKLYIHTFSIKIPKQE